MRRILGTFVALLVATTVTADDGEVAVKVVTYGSVIKLEHIETARRLHSHKLPYGSGSGQQSVTSFPDAGDVNSYWIVKGAHVAKSATPSGRPVACDDTIRLQHLQTGLNLHSHLHRAPMSSDYEVSAYADVAEENKSRWNDGDTGDNWIVQCADGSSGEWQRFAKVSLKHVDTSHFLSSSARHVYSDPIPNQLQVCSTKRKTRDAYWRTNEGIFMNVVKTA